jgi:gliding motility-associated protein GldM
MSGAKETPRQKMIGMMYLFYTALLALNISSDILNAFILVNNSMVQTNTNFGSKNELIMNAFEKQYMMNEKKVKPYYDKALLAKQYSDELVEYLNWLNDTLVVATEGFEKSTNIEYTDKDINGEDSIVTYAKPHDIPVIRLKNKDKYNVPQQILIPEIPGVTKQADVMKEKFAEYNSKILGLLSEKDRKDIKLGLQTKKAWNSQEKKWEEWEHNTFHHGVLVADIVIINKYISEVLNTEAEVLNKLYSYIDAQTIKFDAVRAAVIPKSNVVIQGSEYSADIFVAAYSKTEVPTVVIKPGADTLAWEEVEKAGANNPNFVYIDSAKAGIVKYTLKTSAANEFKYAGLINIKGPDGKYQHHAFNSSYQVIKPTATVSADKMNVVYRGLDNPMSVSAPGFTNEHTKVSVSGGGRLSSKGGGKFVYNPPKGNVRKVKFNVSGVKDDGTTVAMGSQEFRVLGVPSAIIKVAGVNDGKISGAAIASMPVLTATMEKFAFDLKYRVASYDIMVFSNRGNSLVNESVRSNRIPNNALKKIKKAPRGSILTISNVKIVGPDGTKRALGFTLKIQ